MKTKLMLSTCLLLCTMIWALQGQVMPQSIVKSMTRGINIGNTMEPPSEGAWGNEAIKESLFDDYASAGFNCVRIPITWDGHTSKSAPYAINEAWLSRVEQVIDWGLKRKLIIIINAHHEAWIKDNYSAANTVRFDSIWSQISGRFRHKSDSLLFEIINEPKGLTMAQVNELNVRTLATIRKTNPTRIVIFSGNEWSNSNELINAAIPDDPYLIGYYHSYDPYPFGLVGTGTFGSASDINGIKSKYDQVTNWSKAHNIPVIISEFGAMKACEYNARMYYYATAVEQALVHGVPFMAWDDGGDFKICYRKEHTWHEIKDILIHTYKESPTKMAGKLVADTLIQMSWTNRTADNDSIVVERKMFSDTLFGYLKKISPTASAFTDSTCKRGNTYVYRLRTMLADSIELQSYPFKVSLIPTFRKPFHDEAMAIPGTVEAEDFDFGGEGLTYHDVDDANQGNKYRLKEGVDLEEHGTGLFHVAYTAVGEWLEYTINVALAGTYTITAGVAATSAGGQFNFKFPNTLSKPFTAVATSGWADFLPISNDVVLKAGEQSVRLNITKGPAFNIDNIIIAPATSVPVACINNIVMYPNPTSGNLHILNIQGKTTVDFFDMCGKLVATRYQSGQAENISIHELSAGVYSVRFVSGNKTMIRKLVKQ